jgi:preprotein translocase subunit SecA
MSILERALHVGEGKKFKQLQKRVGRINDFEPEMELLDDAELRTEYEGLRERAAGGESLEDLLPHAFALTREAAKRTLGQRHYDVQLIGGMVLHDGAIAEMKTGEGKTLTATLAVVLNALAGRGVHLVTVNDYLARRDAEWMKPIYDMLGVTIGILQSGNYDPEYKRAQYAADVTYGTNSEFGFDYLRDNLATTKDEKAQQRGHYFAIVDEVDNILIDEARTPLIISGQPEQAADLYYKFARLAPKLTPGKKPDGYEAKSKDYEADFDYEPDEKHKTVAITERGVEKSERFLGIENMYLAEHGNLVNHLIQALKAESLYKKDDDYAVIDGEVKIIDEFTGRILEGRRWSEGLHQAIEAKEGVAIQEENQTVATITYQNYFRKYEKLAGMTGTALTEATEFDKIYKLHVVDIPTNRPVQRVDRNDQIFKTKDGKWTAVVNEIAARHATGQPILVGTISVEVSEMLSDRLKKKGVPHTVLNAKPEHAEREGETVAEAGQIGAVTIATNMAGRGVDIKLGGNAEHLTQLELRKLGLEPDTDEWNEMWDDLLPKIEQKVSDDSEKVKELGGLFILGTERHESRRIDNQLRGRSGRQGDPGESRFYLSAEDDLVRLFAGDRIYRILDRLGPVNDAGEEEALDSKMLTKQIEGAQKKVEDQNFLQRKRVLEYDDVMNQQREIIYEAADRRRDRAAGGRVPGRRLRRGLGPRWPLHPARADVPGRADLRGPRPEHPLPRGAGRGAPRRRRQGVRRARGGARRRADARPRALHPAPDHRRALARAPARHGLPARGHPPARVRPDRADRRLQERRLRDVPGADQLHLGGVRPLHLPRRGRGRGRQRLRGRTARAAGRLGGGRRLVVDVDGQLQLPGRRWPGSACGRGRGRHSAGDRRRRRRRARRDRRGPDPGGAAQARRARADRPQRPVLVRLRQEVQEVSWRVATRQETDGHGVQRQRPPRPAEAARGLSLTQLS